MALIPALLTAFSVGLMTLILIQWVSTAVNDASISRVERHRREVLRDASLVYRSLEGPIHGLERLFSHSASAPVDVALPWRRTEIQIASGLVGFVISFYTFQTLALFLGFSIAALAAIVLFILVFFVFQILIDDQISSKKTELVRRLPYAIDLMALVMEASEGAVSLRDSFDLVARENAGHFLGDQFGEMVNDLDAGRTEREVLEEFSANYDNEAIRGFVSSLLQGKELGVPIEKTLRNQSAIMLQKRGQWIEKASAEAKVKITGPGFLIAICCMAIMLAPFMLQVAFTSLF